MNKCKKVLMKSGVFLGLNIAFVVLAVLTGKHTENVKDFKDIREDYDDEEFYVLTHNEDGSLNEYGKSLES